MTNQEYDSDRNASKTEMRISDITENGASNFAQITIDEAGSDENFADVLALDKDVFVDGREFIQIDTSILKTNSFLAKLHVFLHLGWQLLPLHLKALINEANNSKSVSLPLFAGAFGLILVVVIWGLLAFWKIILTSTLAFMLGFVVGAPALQERREDNEVKMLLERLATSPLSFVKPRSPSTTSVSNGSLLQMGSGEVAGPLISDTVDGRLDIVLDRLVESIISPWFGQLNRSRNREFYTCVRISINAAIQNLLGILSSQPTKDTLTVMLFGLTKALQLHLQEFRHFERILAGGTGICDSAEDFLTGPHSHRPFFRTAQEEAEHLKQVSALLLKRLLPRQESRSINLNALLREVIGGNVLWGILDRISDPDFINMEIVKKLQEYPDEPAFVETGWNVIIIKGKVD